jgi:hypothetical protein
MTYDELMDNVKEQDALHYALIEIPDDALVRRISDDRYKINKVYIVQILDFDKSSLKYIKNFLWCEPELIRGSDESEITYNLIDTFPTIYQYISDSWKLNNLPIVHKILDDYPGFIRFTPDFEQNIF